MEAQCCGKAKLGDSVRQDRRKTEGTDFQIIRFNLSKVKELATASGAKQGRKKA